MPPTASMIGSAVAASSLSSRCSRSSCPNSSLLIGELGHLREADEEIPAWYVIAGRGIAEALAYTLAFGAFTLCVYLVIPLPVLP